MIKKDDVIRVSGGGGGGGGGLPPPPPPPAPSNVIIMSSSEGETKKKFQTFDLSALKPGVGMDFIYCEESEVTENFAERNCAYFLRLPPE